ncbi:MAG TPA: VanZ family protein [Terrimicrobiaceae bacterium]
MLWILSSLPGDDLQLPPFPGADKLVHFGYFSVGAFLLGWLLRTTIDWPGWKVTCAVVFVIAIVGALDEAHQLHTAQRSGADPFDWIADCAGGFLGAVVIGCLYVRNRDRDMVAASKVVADGD